MTPSGFPMQGSVDERDDVFRQARASVRRGEGRKKAKRHSRTGVGQPSFRRWRTARQESPEDLAQGKDIGGFAAGLAGELFGSELGNHRRLAARGRALGIGVHQRDVHEQRRARAADQACLRPDQAGRTHGGNGTSDGKSSARQIENDAEDGVHGQRRHAPPDLVQ